MFLRDASDLINLFIKKPVKSALSKNNNGGNITNYIAKGDERMATIMRLINYEIYKITKMVVIKRMDKKNNGWRLSIAFKI